MKYILIFFLIFSFNKVNAQLLQLSDKTLYRISGGVERQLNKYVYTKARKDTSADLSFVLKVQLGWLSKTRAKVIDVTTIDYEGGMPMNIDLKSVLDSSDFGSIIKNRAVRFIYIPIFYSMVDKTKRGSEYKDSYYVLWERFEKLFVRDHIRREEIFTMPVTIFGAIYE